MATKKKKQTKSVRLTEDEEQYMFDNGLCRWNMSGGGCRYGEGCKFTHRDQDSELQRGLKAVRKELSKAAGPSVDDDSKSPSPAPVVEERRTSSMPPEGISKQAWSLMPEDLRQRVLASFGVKQVVPVSTPRGSVSNASPRSNNQQKNNMGPVLGLHQSIWARLSPTFKETLRMQYNSLYNSIPPGVEPQRWAIMNMDQKNAVLVKLALAQSPTCPEGIDETLWALLQKHLQSKILLDVSAHQKKPGASSSNTGGLLAQLVLAPMQPNHQFHDWADGPFRSTAMVDADPVVAAPGYRLFVAANPSKPQIAYCAVSYDQPDAPCTVRIVDRSSNSVSDVALHGPGGPLAFALPEPGARATLYVLSVSNNVMLRCEEQQQSQDGEPWTVSNYTGIVFSDAIESFRVSANPDIGSFLFKLNLEKARSLGLPTFIGFDAKSGRLQMLPGHLQSFHDVLTLPRIQEVVAVRLDGTVLVFDCVESMVAKRVLRNAHATGIEHSDGEIVQIHACIVASGDLALVFLVQKKRGVAMSYQWIAELLPVSSLFVWQDMSAIQNDICRTSLEGIPRHASSVSAVCCLSCGSQNVIYMGMSNGEESALVSIHGAWGELGFQQMAQKVFHARSAKTAEGAVVIQQSMDSFLFGHTTSTTSPAGAPPPGFVSGSAGEKYWVSGDFVHNSAGLEKAAAYDYYSVDAPWESGNNESLPLPLFRAASVSSSDGLVGPGSHGFGSMPLSSAPTTTTTTTTDAARIGGGPLPSSKTTTTNAATLGGGPLPSFRSLAVDSSAVMPPFSSLQEDSPALPPSPHKEPTTLTSSAPVQTTKSQTSWSSHLFGKGGKPGKAARSNEPADHPGVFPPPPPRLPPPTDSKPVLPAAIKVNESVKSQDVLGMNELRRGRKNSLLLDEDMEECAICMEDMNDLPYVLKLRGCGHSFHTRCIHAWYDYSSGESQNCPTCKQTFVHSQEATDSEAKDSAARDSHSLASGAAATTTTTTTTTASSSNTAALFRADPAAAPAAVIAQGRRPNSTRADRTGASLAAARSDMMRSVFGGLESSSDEEEEQQIINKVNGGGSQEGNGGSRGVADQDSGGASNSATVPNESMVEAKRVKVKGDKQMKKKKWKKAYEFYSMAMSLCPDEPEFVHACAEAMKARNKVQATVKLLERLVDLQPDVVQYRAEYAQMLFKNCMVDEACAQYELVFAADSALLDPGTEFGADWENVKSVIQPLERIKDFMQLAAQENNLAYAVASKPFFDQVINRSPHLENLLGTKKQAFAVVDFGKKANEQCAQATTQMVGSAGGDHVKKLMGMIELFNKQEYKPYPKARALLAQLQFRCFLYHDALVNAVLALAYDKAFETVPDCPDTRGFRLDADSKGFCYDLVRLEACRITNLALMHRKRYEYAEVEYLPLRKIGGWDVDFEGFFWYRQISVSVYALALHNSGRLREAAWVFSNLLKECEERLRRNAVNDKSTLGMYNSAVRFGLCEVLSLYMGGNLIQSWKRASEISVLYSEWNMSDAEDLFLTNALNIMKSCIRDQVRVLLDAGRKDK